MRRFVTLLLVLVLCYLGAYVVDSLAGGYHLRPTADGSVEVLGIDVPTQVRWQPWFGYVGPDERDTGGWIFAPLIAIDQWVVHPTIDLGDDEGMGQLIDAIRQDRLHPDFAAVSDNLPDILRDEQ